MIARLIISPSLENRLEKINQILSEEEIPTNHPDTLYFPNDTKLRIEQAKKVKEHFLLKPYQLKGKAVVLEDASLLTVEAQNALLKTLEEPPENAILILGAPSEDKLLPTIISRCEIIILKSTTVIPAKAGIQKKEGTRIPDHSSTPLTPSVRDDIKNLINSSTEERFEYIANLKEKEEFLQALIQYFRQELHAPRSHLVRLKVQFFLKELLKAEEWETQNVNIRAILEYLMLVMPH